MLTFEMMPSKSFSYRYLKSPLSLSIPNFYRKQIKKSFRRLVLD